MADQGQELNTRTATKDDIAEALALLKKQREYKAKEKAKRQDPKFKAIEQERTRRYTAKNTLFIEKAKKAGITVSETEIDAYLASKK